MPEKPDLTPLPSDPTKLPLPPGTMGLPLIGQSIQLLKDNRGFFLERFKKYGPVFKTSFAGNKVACFVGHGALTFFYDPEYFARQDANGDPVNTLFNKVAIPLIDGEQHRLRKELYRRTVSTAAMTAFLPSMQAAIGKFLQRWERMGKFVWRTENEYLCLGLSNLLMLGDETGSADPKQKEVIDTYTAGMAALPIPLPFTKYGKAKKALGKLLQWVGDAMVTHRKRLQENRAIPDILTNLIRENEASGRPLSDDILRTDGAHVYFSIYTGWALQLTFLCMSLGLNRGVMARAREEVLKHSPRGDVKAEELRAMPYVRRVTQEVRRLNPVLPVTFQALVRKTCAFNGYQIPAGWTAIASVYATMQDPAIFLSPETFDPDRFAPAGISPAHLTSDRIPADLPANMPTNSYVPHGGGDPLWHRCLGEDASNVFLQLMTVLLLRCYDWDLPEQDLRMQPGQLFSVPRSGLEVVFRRM